MKVHLLTLTSAGLYCKAGDFYLDPWKPVHRAVISHGHSDHARPGHQHYLTHKETAVILQHRLGLHSGVQSMDYGQPITIGSVKVSLHPAGHIPGSSQIRVEHKGEVWVLVVIGVLLAACAGLCIIAAIGVSQMQKEGAFDEWGTAVSSDLPIEGTPTTVAFPLLDPDEVAKATTQAGLVITREQIAIEATTNAENAPIEQPTEISDIEPAAATRESLIATRSAAANVTTEAPETGSDAEATREALIAERNAAAVASRLGAFLRRRMMTLRLGSRMTWRIC